MDKKNKDPNMVKYRCPKCKWKYTYGKKYLEALKQAYDGRYEAHLRCPCEEAQMVPVSRKRKARKNDSK